MVTETEKKRETLRLADVQKRRAAATPTTPRGLRTTKPVGADQLNKFITQMDRPSFVPSKQTTPVRQSQALPTSVDEEAVRVKSLRDAQAGLMGESYTAQPAVPTGNEQVTAADVPGAPSLRDPVVRQQQPYTPTGGSFSVVSGPGGPADPNDIPGSIQRNVDAYNRQTEALRNARSGMSGATSEMRKASAAERVNVIPDSGAAAREARNLRVGSNDLIDSLSRRGRGGSIRGQIEAAKLMNEQREGDLDRGVDLRDQDITARGQDVADINEQGRQRLTARGQDITAEQRDADRAVTLRNQDMQYAGDIASRAADLQAKGATYGLNKQKYNLEKQKFARKEVDRLAEVFAGTKDTDSPRQHDAKMREFENYAANSGIGPNSEPEDVANFGQMTRLAGSLQEIKGIGGSVWPWAAKIFDFMKANTTGYINTQQILGDLRQVVNTGRLTIGDKTINVEDDWTPSSKRMLMEYLNRTNDQVQ